MRIFYEVIWHVFSLQGLLVACGSSRGTVYLAELSTNLGTADKNDKQLLTHVSIYRITR